MELTRKQKKILALLHDSAMTSGSGKIPEDLLHMTLSLAQGFLADGKGSGYNFELDCWNHIDKKFESKLEYSPISIELHKDIEDMIEKGYFSRDEIDPIAIIPTEPEVFFGFFSSFDSNIGIGNFNLLICGKRKKDLAEEIAGGIFDALGRSDFYGERGDGFINFTKIYDPDFSSKRAVKSKLVYKGNLENEVYKGSFSWMHKGEIPQEGRFIMSKSQEKIAEESAYLAGSD